MLVFYQTTNFFMVKHLNNRSTKHSESVGMSPCLIWASFWSPVQWCYDFETKKCNNINRPGQMYSNNTRGPLWQRETHPDLPLLCLCVHFSPLVPPLWYPHLPLLLAGIRLKVNDPNVIDNYWTSIRTRSEKKQLVCFFLICPFCVPWSFTFQFFLSNFSVQRS